MGDSANAPGFVDKDRRKVIYSNSQEFNESNHGVMYMKGAKGPAYHRTN